MNIAGWRGRLNGAGKNPKGFTGRDFKVWPLAVLTGFSYHVKMHGRCAGTKQKVAMIKRRNFL